MRPFAPTTLHRNPDHYCDLIEQRLLHSGEYVRHIPVGGIEQWVVMNHQFIPVDASINPDFAVTGTDPRLWGCAEHFGTQPSRYDEGDDHDGACGSQFEVDGFMYNVKRVNINHNSGIYIELVRDNKCTERRAGWEADLSAVLCTPATSSIEEDVECCAGQS